MKRKFSSSTFQMNAYRKPVWIWIIFKGESFLVRCPFKANTNLSQPGGFFFQPCMFFPCQIIFGAGSAEHENSNKSPEAWNNDCMTGSQSRPDLPSRPALLTVFIAPSYLLFSDTIFSLHVAPQRDAGKTPSDASSCGTRSLHSRHVRRLWSF